MLRTLKKGGNLWKSTCRLQVLYEKKEMRPDLIYYPARLLML